MIECDGCGQQFRTRKGLEAHQKSGRCSGRLIVKEEKPRKPLKRIAIVGNHTVWSRHD